MTVNDIRTFYIRNAENAIRRIKFYHETNRLNELKILRAIIFVLYNASIFELAYDDMKKIVELYLIITMINPDFKYPDMADGFFGFTNANTNENTAEEDLISIWPMEITLDPMTGQSGTGINVESILTWNIN